MKGATLRSATEADLPALADIYRSSVEALGPTLYSEPQVEVWKAFPEQEDAFRNFVLSAHTLVAEDDSGPIGFAGVQANGRIASLYVRGDRLHEGIGTMLLEAILVHAGRRPLYAEASEFSLDLFHRFGFETDEEEHVTLHGVHFKRYIVTRGGKPCRSTNDWPSGYERL